MLINDINVYRLYLERHVKAQNRSYGDNKLVWSKTMFFATIITMSCPQRN